jgi:hypothetical protein
MRTSPLILFPFQKPSKKSLWSTMLLGRRSSKFWWKNGPLPLRPLSKSTLTLSSETLSLPSMCRNYEGKIIKTVSLISPSVSKHRKSPIALASLRLS